jgi:hypothetical protein
VVRDKDKIEAEDESNLGLWNKEKCSPGGNPDLSLLFLLLSLSDLGIDVAHLLSWNATYRLHSSYISFIFFAFYFSEF